MKTVIEMAREAGYMRTVHGGAEVSMASMDCLERFAELVRADAIADEREACAKVADGFIGCDAIVHKIRARSNK